MNGRNNELKKEFSECLEAMHAYFVTLAKNDPKKAEQRSDSYLEIHRMISGLENKDKKAHELEDKNEDKVGKFADSFLSFVGIKDNKGKGKDKIEKKNPINASDILEISLKNIIAKCREHATTYQGKGGRQGYTTILNRLADAIEADIKTPVSTAQLLNKVDKDLTIQKVADCTAALSALRAELNDNYIPVLDFEIKQQGNRFFDKKIDVKLSSQKLSIANGLSDSLRDFVALPDKEKLKNISRLVNSIVRDDQYHKEVLEGTIGKGKRLGDLLTEAKKIIKENFPAEYAHAKAIVNAQVIPVEDTNNNLKGGK